VNAISTATAENIAGFPYTITGSSWNGPIVADIDGDNHLEVLVGTISGRLIALNNDGTLNFERNLGGQIKGSIVTGDLNNDSVSEIIFVKATGELYIVDNNGNDAEEFPNFPVNLGSGTEATPVLADMDNNGTVDIILGDNDGYLHSIDINGNETANFPIPLATTIKTSAALGDADNDGDLDIAVPNQSSFILVDYKNNTGMRLWNCFKKNTSRTGNAAQSYTSTDENEVPQFSTKLGKNYPNPFNPSTSIAFSVKKTETVKLEIFNIKGQLVKTLIDDVVKQGYHTTVWNGTDSKNQTVSSGLYLYKLSTKDHSEIKKMLMVK